MADPNTLSCLSRGNPVVFFDVTVGGKPIGRIKIELFKLVAPRAVENFRQFCTGEYKKGPAGLPVGYKNTRFHRIISGFMIQGGDFLKGNGTGRTCIFGDHFDDEHDGLLLKHDKPGILSMANSGPNTNGCQFFITTGKADWLDGKHVVFGKVLDQESMFLIRMLENVPVDPSTHQPKIDCVISDCGEF
jgi:peptidyl-prolyl isomerase H (cyclophilin H)